MESEGSLPQSQVISWSQSPPQVAGGGTASIMEGSCEYIE